MEESLLAKKNCEKKNTVELAVKIFVVVAFAIFSIVVASVALHRMWNIEEKVRVVMKAIPPPSKYVLPQQSYTPVISQGSRGTCWNFAQVGVLEGSYRKNGFAKGFLNETEYVKFSEQGFSKKYVDYCQSIKFKTGDEFNKWCLFGGMLLGKTDPAHPESRWGLGTTSDGEIELMYYMYDHVHDGLFPEAVCPYEALPGPNNENEKKCEHEKDAHDKNPIVWRVTDMTSAYDIATAKKIIYNTKTACGFSSVLYSNVYTIRCDDDDASDFVKESLECKNCIWRRSDGKCEYKQVVREYDWGGRFINHFSSGQDFIRTLGGHAQTIVGYNDDWVTDLGGFGDPADYEKGAIILKNSWGADKGHSVAFLAGEISMIEERNICPMHGDPQNWVPIDPLCLETNKNPEKCSQGVKQLLRDKWIYGATPLKCASPSTTFYNSVAGTFCNQSKVYYLSSYRPDEFNNSLSGHYEDGAPSGYQDLSGRIFMYRPREDRPSIVYRIVEWDPVEKTVKTFLTKDAGWWLLGVIFKPLNFVPNDPVLCGYYPMPYSTMAKDSINQPQNDKDTASITCFDIEWDDSSYLKSKSSKLDYSYLEKSTKIDKIMDMVGPFAIYPAQNKFAAKKHQDHLSL